MKRGTPRAQRPNVPSPAPGDAPVEVGAGPFRYRALPAWGRLPEGYAFSEVVGVATDSADRVFVFNRGEHPVIVFDRNGEFQGSWGDGRFVRPHGIAIGPDDAVYCTDDVDHTVRIYAPDGRLLSTLGRSGQGADTGVIDVDYRTIRRVGPPFHRPTNVALAPDGTLYVADGYGNARIHHFSAGGVLLHSWGSPGSGPGQFNLPHGIAVDGEGRVYVADRENSRVQLFASTGEYVGQWTDVVRPTEVFVDAEGTVFVAEMGWKAGLFPWQQPPPDAPAGRLSLFDRSGRRLARWGGGADPTAPGDFFGPHDVWVDRSGDLYVSEVLQSGGFVRASHPRDGHTLQKFMRVRDSAD
jgi:DNA-binding beta-propeller fold protein YncE